ncbi:MAG: efflux RND transporter periplasmic adaptor subunit [Thermodesulfobacteriota bacterium]
MQGWTSCRALCYNPMFMRTPDLTEDGGIMQHLSGRKPASRYAATAKVKALHVGSRQTLFLIACFASLIVASCGQPQGHVNREFPPIPVEIAKADQKDMPFFLEGIGNVAAFNSVEIKSRVTGELLKRHFTQGDRIAKGQRLFTIDPAPFEAKVREAEARVNQAAVQYRQSKKDFERFQGLHSEKAVSLEQLETKEVDMNSKLYEMELRKAELETAKLNLSYCFIDSPLEGQSGEILVDDHNIVNANQDPLVTVKQLHPIKVKFSVPGKFLEEIKDGQARKPLEVEANVQGFDKPETGRLTLIDNRINLKTGMIGLEATFDNPKDRLWPGQFVSVRLKLSTTRDAVVVTSLAVNQGPTGQYVWLVKEDQTVDMRPIKVARSGNGMHIVSEGLAKSDTVVSDGQLMLRPGAKIITRAQMAEMMKQTSKEPSKEAGKK